MIPKELYEEIKKGNCVIFAGAGISTEGGIYGQPTFYYQIKEECNLKDDGTELSFPELTQLYCDKIDGGHKNKLIRKIIERIEEFSEYGEIYWATTIFHRYITQVPFFSRIITTNWDTFFERELNVLVPMVEDNNIPFWDDKKRQILKIHGCVTRPHTIIATSKDYDKLIITESKKPIFTKLKDLMATKTFLFIGYSMRDKNIQLIYDNLLKNLGEFARLSYAVDPHPIKKTVDNWKKRGIIILDVSAISFMRELITNLVNEDIIPDPELVEYYSEQHNSIVKIHSSMKQDTPKEALSSTYQDGSLHQLQEIIRVCKIGITNKELQELYQKCLKELNNVDFKINPTEFAYRCGRVEVLKRFIDKKKESIPAYFDPIKIMPSVN